MKKLGFGCMRLPIINNDYSHIDIEKFKVMVDAFMAKGFTYYDTAYVYHSGNSEKALYEALVKRYPRDSYTITTKMPLSEMHSDQEKYDIFNEQLKRLHVDYIDYYWLHALNKNNLAQAEKYHVFEYIAQMKKEGKIKHIGFSYHDNAELLEKILIAHPEMEFVQLQINYVDWDSQAIQGRKCYDLCVKYHKPVIVMEPLKGGALVDVPNKAKEVLEQANPNMSIASWGIRYCASLDNVMMVLSGMSNLQQVEDNIAYMDNFKPLNEDEYKAISKVVDIINANNPIACTRCRYCVAGCPQNIPIPEYFAFYNELAKMEGKNNLGGYYSLLAEKTNKASACIKCGKCERVCPQHLPIRDWLVKVAGEFEK